MAHNPSRWHHFIPRKYLNHFAAEEKRKHIWIYEKRLPYQPGSIRNVNNPVLDSTINAGAEMDFFAYQKRDGLLTMINLKRNSQKLKEYAIQYLTS